MERVLSIWNASLLGRGLEALCLWCGRQWEKSWVVQSFLSPMAGEEHSRSSIFFKIWQLVRRFLCWLYDLLHLEKLFRGSVFTKTFLWCAIPATVAPALDFFRPSLMVLGLAFVGCASLLLNLIRDRERELAYSPVNRFVILYAMIYLAGTFFSSNRGASLGPGLMGVAFTLFAVVLYNTITGRKQLDAMVELIVLAGTAVSFYGILQYIFGWGYQSAAWVDSDMFSAIGFRVTATLENPNMLGQYLILTIPLGGARLLSAKGLGQRLYYFCCCAIMCLCMILTYSRGAWLGLLFAGAVFVVMINPRFILLAPFALVALYFVLPETVVSRFTSIGNLTDNSTSYRVNIWLGTLAMLKDGYWLCGIGPGDGAFNQIYPAYSFNAITTPHSHNLFLQILCDAGVCALVVFIIILIQYVRRLCVAMKDRSDWRSRILQIAFLSGMAGFMVQAMTDYSFYNYRVMFMFWVYLAVGMRMAQRNELPEGRLFS